MQEFHLENILAKYPDLIEPDLSLIRRQLTINRKRMDLLFQDGHGIYLVVEVKVGALSRTDIGQLSEYCHYMFKENGVRPRGMLIGTRVPDEILGAAGFNGFECKCLPLSFLEQAMVDRGDREMLEPLRLLRVSPASASNETQTSDIQFQEKPSVASTQSPEISISAKENDSGAKPTVADMLRTVLSGTKAGTLLKSHEITSSVLNSYAGKITKEGILISDKCYNTTNAGLSANHDFRIFEYMGHATYRYVGEGYPYTGHVTWKGVRCGLWSNGVLAKWDNWPILRAPTRK